MKKIGVGTDFTIFLLFFGVAALEAFKHLDQNGILSSDTHRVYPDKVYSFRSRLPQ